MGEKCLSFELKRDDHGRVACDLIWQLPSSSQPGSGTPTACDEQPFLQNVAGSRRASNDRGGNNCVVKQLAVTDLSSNGDGVESGDGWYYDDFSSETWNVCPKASLRRVAFSANARPPVDVQVVLDCDVNAKVD